LPSCNSTSTSSPQAGDVLVRYDGRPVTQAVLFDTGRAGESPASPRPLVVLRQGKERSFPLPSGPHGLELLDEAVAKQER
jgi:S1-C subfamily serine protease